MGQGFQAKKVSDSTQGSQCANSAREVATTKRARYALSLPASRRFEKPPGSTPPASGRRSFHAPMASR
jgi:hypothetical protein